MPVKNVGRQHTKGDEELWAVAGHDGRSAFVAGVIVSGGVVSSVPALMGWMEGRPWLDVAQLCLDRGWTVSPVDPRATPSGVARERARNRRGVVQSVLPGFGPPTT